MGGAIAEACVIAQHDGDRGYHLFTDIEGSSRLWETRPDRMPDALARDDAIARDAFRQAGGQFIKTTGRWTRKVRQAKVEVSFLRRSLKGWERTMKKSKFSEEQIAYALRQADGGTPVGDVCRQLGVSEATFYVWKKKYGKLGLSELREIRQLRDENARLKRLVADLTLDKHILSEVLRKKV
jgi:putative transposase